VVIYLMACVFVGVAVWAFIAWKRQGKNALPYAIWASALAVIDLAVAALAGMRRGESGRLSEEERQRVTALTVLGVLGLATATLGLTLPFAYPEVFGGQLRTWRENMSTVLLCGLLLLGGLLVLIFGLQMARQLAGAYPNLRRAAALYNAAAGTVMLAVVLVLGNLISYIDFGAFKSLNASYDWTSSHLYTLSDQSKQVLADLKQPVKVYVIGTRGDLLTPEVETLLENCRAVTPLITWEVVSRDLQRREYAELESKYSIPSEGQGLLVVYGEGEGASHEFVRRSELFENAAMTREGGTRFQFKGESALVSAIKYLAENRTKAVVYFTQGHGEPAFGGPATPFARQGLSVLKDDLEKRRYEAKPLRLGPGVTVPENADVVVVVAPQVEMPAKVTAVLSDYLHGTGRKGKGRLVVLLPPSADVDGREIRTGLEPLLAEFNVKVGHDRVLTVMGEGDGKGAPLVAIAITNPESSNPIARAFLRFRGGGLVSPRFFRLDDARTVRRAAAAPGAVFTADEIMIVPAQMEDFWVEENVKADPRALYRELMKPDNLPKLKAKLAAESAPVAVAVSEGAAPPIMPGHPPVGGESDPRLVVFGDASWLGDESLSGADHALNLDLFTSTLAWLRKKADIGVSAEAKERKEYRLQVPPGGGTRLILMPITVALLCILMLGGAVWVVRRR
jgi:hypothetical protein